MQKWKLEKSVQNGLLHHSVGNPRHGLDLHRSVECLAVAKSRDQNGTPRVRHGVASLRRGEVLRRSVATVHSEQISDFCFRTPRISTPIV